MNLFIEWLIWILRIYHYMIVACIIISWFPEYQNTNIAKTMANIVEPYVSIFRRVIPPIGMIDFSVIVSLIFLQIAMRGLASI